MVVILPYVGPIIVFYAIIIRRYGAELDVSMTGAELTAMLLPRWLRAQELGARDAGAETC